MNTERCPECGKSPRTKELAFGGVDLICSQIIECGLGYSYEKVHLWVSGANLRQATRIWNREARRRYRKSTKGLKMSLWWRIWHPVSMRFWHIARVLVKTTDRDNGACKEGPDAAPVKLRCRFCTKYYYEYGCTRDLGGDHEY